MTLATEKKKVQALKEKMHFLTDKGMAKHTVFVDSEKEVEEFNPAEYFDTAEELTGVWCMWAAGGG
jgi:hypothetical protein